MMLSPGSATVVGNTTVDPQITPSSARRAMCYNMLFRVSIAIRITAYGNRARAAGKGTKGATAPAEAMRTLKKSSSFRASFAPYLIP